jgi:hypothetical protein
MSSQLFAGLAAVGLAIGVIVALQDSVIEEVHWYRPSGALNAPNFNTRIGD